MADNPSIESLRAIVYGMKEPSTTEEIEALDAALSELAAYREDARAAAGECLVPIPEPGTDLSRLLIANHALRAENEALRGQIRDNDDVDTAMRQTLCEERDEAERQRDTERARADALAARVEVLEDGMKAIEGMGCVAAVNFPMYAKEDKVFPPEKSRDAIGRIRSLVESLLRATHASDLEAHDARVRREVLEGAAKRALVMLSQSWDPAWGYSDALPGDIQAAILGPEPSDAKGE